MLKIRYHKQFKKDFKLAMKRGLKAELLEEVLNFLVQEKELPARYRDHQLTTSKHFQGVRECHIQPDWLLVYKVDKSEVILNLLRTNLSTLKIHNNSPAKKSKNGHCLPEKIVSGLIKTNHILIRIELSRR